MNTPQAPRPISHFSNDDIDLTPAAAEVLAVHLAALRGQILHEISRTTEDDGGRLAKMSDVRAAIDRLSIKSTRDSTQIRSIYQQIAAFVLGVLLTGAILFWDSLTDSAQTPVFLAGFASIFMAVYAIAVALLLHKHSSARRARTLASSSEFLSRFAELESEARRITGLATGEDTESVRLHVVFNALEKLDIWTPVDTQVFRELLLLRNSLVHEDTRALAPDQAAFGIAEADRLSDLMRTAVRRRTELGSKGRGSGAAQEGMMYETRVLLAIRNVWPESLVMQLNADGGADLLLEAGSASVAIIVTYRDRALRYSDMVREVESLASFDGGILVVTNAELSAEVLEQNARSSDGKQPVEVIRWTSDQDNDLLSRALARCARA